MDADTPKTEHADWLAKLFNAVATEWAELATAIGDLGEALPTEAILNLEPQAIEKLQLFDALRQNAQAQSHLLKALSGEIGLTTSHGFERTRALIDDIPFADMRGRLKVALNEADKRDLHDHADDGTVSWF